VPLLVVLWIFRAVLGHTVAQKTVPIFCHFEQTCTNLTLTQKPALEKHQGDSTASYLQFGALHALFGQKLTEK
jgi:hypothetical protein